MDRLVELLSVVLSPGLARRALVLLALLQPAPAAADDATGDWGGARTWLADRGITLDLDYTHGAKLKL